MLQRKKWVSEIWDEERDVREMSENEVYLYIEKY